MVDAMIRPMLSNDVVIGERIRGLLTGAVRRRDGWSSRCVFATPLHSYAAADHSYHLGRRHTRHSPQRLSSRRGIPPVSKYTCNADCTTRPTAKSSSRCRGSRKQPALPRSTRRTKRLNCSVSWTNTSRRVGSSLGSYFLCKYHIIVVAPTASCRDSG